MTASVTVVGSLNHDIILGAPHLPGRGETVIATTSATGSGGKGANQAAAAAALAPHVSMVGRVGEDEAARTMVDDLVRQGVDTQHVIPTSGVPSGIATVVVEERSGENLIVVAPGANAALTPADVEVVAVRTASVVLLQLEVPMPTVVAAARAATGTVVLNPAPTAVLPPELLECVDVLVPNEWELTRLIEDSASIKAGADDSTESIERNARSLGVRNVVVTLGARGALVVPADGPAVNAVDTTGAGDCFCGALSVALAEGQGLVESARFAVAAAALSTTGHGARSALADRGAVGTIVSTM
jgi:ribokinase